MYARNIELRLHLAAELLCDRVSSGKVVHFFRIIDQIEKLIGINRRVDELVSQVSGLRFYR